MRQPRYFMIDKPHWWERAERGHGIELSPWVSLLLVVGSTLTTTLAMFYIQPMAFYVVRSLFMDSNLLTLWLNWLPVLLVSLVLFVITNRPIFASGLVSFVVIWLGVINRFMILLRNDPLYPWDLTLGQEALSIAMNFGTTYLLIGAVASVVAIVVLVASYMLLKCRAYDWRVRIGLAIALVTTTVVVNNTTYHSQSLLNSLPVHGSVFNPVSTFNSRGFLYSFIFAHNTQRLQLPADFNTQWVRERYDAFVPTNHDNTATPHVIVIMGEAFDDMGLDDPRFDFTGFVDPNYHWRRWTQHPNSIHGHVIVPNIGGGTGDSEFDVLTALNSRALRGVPYSHMLVRGEFEAMPWLLAPLGYRSIFLHPGFAWFYNRQNVFPWFGFEHFYDMSYFRYEDWKGPYISEAATFDKFFELWHSHLAEHPGVPFFNFTLTIQNHGPYANMYGLPEGYENFRTTLDFTEHEHSQVTNFFHGLADVDREIGRLIDYFEHHPEPVVIMYYSDHVPGFSRGIFDQTRPELYPTDSLDNMTRLHQVPFLIWQNHAAAAITPMADNFARLGQPDIMTSNFLGAYLFELLGFTGMSAFWDFVNELRADFPVILEDRAFAGDGTVSLEMDMAERQGLLLYRDWQFYRAY